jgi:hypothetical protein
MLTISNKNMFKSITSIFTPKSVICAPHMDSALSKIRFFNMSSNFSLKPTPSLFLTPMPQFGNANAVSREQAMIAINHYGIIDLMKLRPNVLKEMQGRVKYLPPITLRHINAMFSNYNAQSIHTFSSNAISNVNFTLKEPEILSTYNISHYFAKKMKAYSIPYAIGGSLASSLHGEVRSTMDVDFNVSLTMNNLDAFKPILADLEGHLQNADTDDYNKIMDGKFSFELMQQQCNKKKWACFYYKNFKIELFPLLSKLQTFIFSRKQGTTDTIKDMNSDEQITYLSAESIIACKLLFYRPKDQTDIKGIIAKYSALNKSLDWDLLAEFMDILIKLDEKSFKMINNDHGGIMVRSTVDSVDWLNYILSLYADGLQKPPRDLLEYLKNLKKKKI